MLATPSLIGCKKKNAAGAAAPVLEITQRKTPREPRRFRRLPKKPSSYLETDFLNMRSIFSLVASQQDWLA
jgi:hypothetical protein